MIGFGVIGQQVALGLAPEDGDLVGILVRRPRARVDWAQTAWGGSPRWRRGEPERVALAGRWFFTELTDFLATEPQVVIDAAGPDRVHALGRGHPGQWRNC